MRLVGFGSKADLHGADHPAIHFRHHMDRAALAHVFRHGAPIGFCIPRGEGQHEADGCAALHTFGKDIAEFGQGIDGLLPV